MRWLLHGPMTSAVRDALVRHDQHAQDMTETALPPAAAAIDVLKAARAGQLEILTTDGALAVAPFELSYRFPRVMVYLQLDGADVEQDDAVDRLFTRYKRFTPGRLYTVTGTRVKVRQLPGGR